MRSLMLVLGACLVAFSLSGCSSTGGCNAGCGTSLGGGLLRGGNAACSGGCGDSACSGGCDQNNFSQKNYGGESGLGLGLMEAGPSCTAAGCNGGCQSCQRPQLGGRMRSLMANRPRLANRASGCGLGANCGCGSPAPTLAGMDSGYDAPMMPDSGCGCSASAPVSFSMGDMAGSEYGIESDYDSGVQLASHEDRRGLLGKLGFGRNKVRSAQGCGVRGCGGAGGLCSNCRARLAGALGLGAGAGSIPHRDPTIHSGGAAAGPAGQIPTYAYPYYTTRAPRDFLDPNPPTIGY